MSRRVVSRFRFGFFIRLLLIMGLSLWIAQSSLFDTFFSWLGGGSVSAPNTAQANNSGFPSALSVENGEKIQQITRNKDSHTPSSIVTDVDTSLKLQFNLLRQDNETISSEWYLGKTKLVFYGFTSCPVICPTTLGTITQVMQKLPVDVKEKVQPLFISIDPERDDIFRLKDYATMFDPSIHYLTGSITATDEAAKSMRSYYKRHREKATDATYDVDHSVFIYVVDERGYAKAVIPPTTSVDEIVNYLVKNTSSTKE